VTVTDVEELQVPPRRFWVKVGSVILAEGIKFNSGHGAFHWPGHPMHHHGTFESVSELRQCIDDWGWGESHIVWIDEPADVAEGDELVGDTWHVAAEPVAADHGAASCQGVGL
jgi:hypothetical protein